MRRVSAPVADGRRDVLQRLSSMSETVAPTPPGLEELRTRRSEILEIAARHGVLSVRVFGSVARGEPGAKDVDLLLEMESGRSLLDLAGFHVDVQDLLAVKVDVATVNGLRERVRSDVLVDAVSL
jgi:uncharacterized protein